MSSCIYNTADMTESIVDLAKVKYNEYHREYYKNKVDKNKRAAQFSAYYLKHKEAICKRRKEQRLLLKQQKETHAVVVE